MILVTLFSFVRDSNKMLKGTSFIHKFMVQSSSNGVNSKNVQDIT